MRPCVVDASVMVATFFDTSGRGPAARRSLTGRTPVAPQLLPFELLQAARGLERRGELSADDAVSGLHGALAAPVQLFPITELADRIWELRRSVTAYDASYVALAEWLRFPLITLDERLARASGPSCEFIVPD